MDIRSYKTVTPAIRALKTGIPSILFAGDCTSLIKDIPDSSIDLTVTSPNYCMGKEYENSTSIEDFIKAHEELLPQIVRITRDGGSICWQVGYHVKEKRVYPLDYAVFSVFQTLKDVVLRNRIVWHFGHGLHSSMRFSGRHEVVLWFTKGSGDYHFDLDAVRVPQKYPGKRHYKGPNKGQLSSNPKGKNPSDVWDIPNVKANHVEKLDHPCQFPVGLADRLVRALCPKSGVVFDPHMGTSSTGVAAIVNGRRFVGAEINKKYFEIAETRLQEAVNRTVSFRPAEQPIHVPSRQDVVARRPAHFAEFQQLEALINI
jgi:adenine-specific DNA-methyltransferase